LKTKSQAETVREQMMMENKTLYLLLIKYKQAEEWESSLLYFSYN
jgi:hypothetical protein